MIPFILKNTQFRNVTTVLKKQLDSINSSPHKTAGSLVKPEPRTSGSLILAPSLTKLQNRWFSDIWTTTKTCKYEQNQIPA
jgi:hypothetical protein